MEPQGPATPRRRRSLDLLLVVPTLILLAPVFFYGFTWLSGLAAEASRTFFGGLGMIAVAIPLFALSSIGYGWLLLACVFRRARSHDTFEWVLAGVVIVLSALFALAYFRLAGMLGTSGLVGMLPFVSVKRLNFAGALACIGLLAVIGSVVLRQIRLRRTPSPAAEPAAVPHSGRWALVTLLTVALVFGGAAGAVRFRSYRAAQDTLQSVRSELTADFVGFDISRFTYQESGSNVGFDSSPWSQVRFEMRYRNDPRLRLAGTYYLSGGHVQDSRRLTVLRGTIFNGRVYSTEQVTAFAAAWAHAYPNAAIQVGETLIDSRHYFNPGMTGRLSKRFHLESLHGFVPFPDAADARAAWFYYDADTKAWSSVGTTPSLIRAYGR
jgi:hypothetical protein